MMTRQFLIQVAITLQEARKIIVVANWGIEET